MRRIFRSLRIAAVAAAVTIIIALLLSFRVQTVPPAATSTAIKEPSELAVGTSDDDIPQIIDGFAGVDLEASIADLCAGDEFSDISVAAMSGDEQLLSGMAEYDNTIRSAKERLTVSLDAEHLHGAAILESDVLQRIDLITRAMVIGKDDPFVVWDAVRICADVVGQTGCPLQAWEEQLLDLDGHNSEVWIRVAANRLDAGDEAAALRAMQRAGSASESRVYWTETIEMITRVYAAAGDYSFLERATSGFGIAVSNQPNYGTLHRMCKEQSAVSQDWAYACLAYGELVERQGKTALGKSIAQWIQRGALEAVGNEEQLAAVTARQESDRKNRGASSGSPSWLSEAIMFSNPALFSGYLAAIREHGEIRARAKLDEEIDQWLSQHEIDLACVP